MFEIYEDDDFKIKFLEKVNPEEKESIENSFFFNDIVEIQNKSFNKYNSLVILFRVLLGNVKINFKEDLVILPSNTLSRALEIPNLNSIDSMKEEENEREEIKKLEKDGLSSLNIDEISEESLNSSEESLKNMELFINDFFDSETGSYLEKEYKYNHKYFDKILNEVLHFYYYTHKDNDFSAFLHLYRAYEYISYLFPLSYIQNSREYIQSYKELQSFFKDTGEELSFLNVFIKHTFLKDEYLIEDMYKETYTLKLTGEEYDFFKKEMSEFITKFNSNQEKKKKSYFKNILEIEPETEDGTTYKTYLNRDTKELVISTMDVNDLLVTLRNKTCHLKMNHGDSLVFNNYLFDDLFKIMNPIFLNWISNILKFVTYRSSQRFITTI